MMRGVFGLDRGVLDHEIFPNIAYSEKEAWIWLIAEAAWKPRTRRIGEYVAKLERGQLLGSVRYLADKWQWSRGKVERFLNKLKTETMIETHTETGITVITVCNYAKYQRVALPVETDTEEQNGQMRDSRETDARQSRDNTEEIKHLNNEKEDGADAPPNVISLSPSPEKLFFDQAVQILGPEARSFAAKLLKAKDRNIFAAHAALLTAAGKSDPKQYIGAIIRGDDEDEEERRRRRSF